MKAFIVSIASFAALLVVVSAEGLDPTEMHCIPGQSYMVDCNYCHCNSNGSFGACSFMACPQYPICTDGAMKRNDRGDVCICRRGQLFCYPSECDGKQNTKKSENDN